MAKLLFYTYVLLHSAEYLISKRVLFNNYNRFFVITANVDSEHQPAVWKMSSRLTDVLLAGSPCAAVWFKSESVYSRVSENSLHPPAYSISINLSERSLIANKQLAFWAS